MTDAPTQGPTAAHPPLAPPRSTAPRHQDTSVLLDDRGKPVILAELATLRDALYENKPPFPWRRVLAWTLVVVLGAWILLSMFNAISPQFPLGCMWPLGSLIPALAWRRAGRAATVKHDRVSCASLVRIGRCGGCGFSLKEFAPGQDGCVACPECGAAWSPDRWRHSSPSALACARTRIDAPPNEHSDRQKVDDRGVPLAASYMWEPKWYSAVFDRFIRNTIAFDQWTAARSFYAEGSAALIRLRVRNGLWFAGGLGVLTAIIWAIGFDRVSIDAYAMAVFLTVIGLIVAMSTAQTSVDTRGLALKHSLCPACGELLDLNQPRQFDGCIQCAKCAAAWKLTDAQPELGAKGTTPAALSQSVTLAPSHEGRSHD